MNLVTEQGKAAQLKFDNTVKNIKTEIMSSLYNNVVFTPTSLANRYHHSLQKQVTEAMWQLLDEKKIQLTIDRQLALSENK